MVNLIDPELVIGFVGRMGVDSHLVSKCISEILHELHYDSNEIKLTDFLKVPELKFKLEDSPIEARYRSYIESGNKLRERAGRKDFFAVYAVTKIIETREEKSEETDVPLRRSAYIINQIKRPEEASALREVYGDQFVLISCHSPTEKRVSDLSRKIADAHPSSPNADEWNSSARELIKKDNDEEHVPFGQRVRDAFPEADVIVDARNETTIKETLRRFFHALFGNFKISPTKDEFFQNVAWNVSLTSRDTARQVGAAIERNGYVISTGYNEAPKAKGGTYWPDDGQDARDVELGSDINTVRKRHMALEIIQILRDRKKLADPNVSDSEIEFEFLDSEEAPLKNSQIMSSLEYGRAVHAEMAAISAAAVVGTSTYDTNLHCTTFPCHNCAKHIVATGIMKVIYLKPYPKSFVADLYPDSISIDSLNEGSGLVQFKQFIGITPKRYKYLFETRKIKDKFGKVIKWVPKGANPKIESSAQEQMDKEVIFLNSVKDQLPTELREIIGIPD